MINFAVISKAGMRPSDIAKLLRISRVCASLWVNGHNQPHRLIEKRVELLISAVTAAVQAKTLPVHSSTPKAERFEKVAAAIAAQLPNGLTSIEE